MSRTTKDGSACICMHFPSSLGWPYRRRGDLAAAGSTFPPVIYPASAGLDLHSRYTSFPPVVRHAFPYEPCVRKRKVTPRLTSRSLILCRTTRACSGSSRALVFRESFHLFPPFFFSDFLPINFESRDDRID